MFLAWGSKVSCWWWHPAASCHLLLLALRSPRLHLGHFLPLILPRCSGQPYEASLSALQLGFSLLCLSSPLLPHQSTSLLLAHPVPVLQPFHGPHLSFPGAVSEFSYCLWWDHSGIVEDKLLCLDEVYCRCQTFLMLKKGEIQFWAKSKDDDLLFLLRLLVSLLPLRGVLLHSQICHR